MLVDYMFVDSIKGRRRPVFETRDEASEGSEWCGNCTLYLAPLLPNKGYPDSLVSIEVLENVWVAIFIGVKHR